jgi:hypothetical protein
MSGGDRTGSSTRVYCHVHVGICDYVMSCLVLKKPQTWLPVAWECVEPVR